MAIDHGETPPQNLTPLPHSGAEWRWRNYTNHLADLGYDLANGSAKDDDSLEGAVSDYLARRAREQER